jgi:anti-sigma factor RsiW
MRTHEAWLDRENAILLVNAYVDGELDAAAALYVERRMHEEPALQSEHDRLVALRAALAAHGPHSDRAPDVFRARMAAIGQSSEQPAPAALRGFGWRQMAAGLALAACFGGVVTFVGLRHDWQSATLRGVVMAHQAALLDAQPYQVASADTHTVKPWFDRQIALSPQVIDLSDAGFPLLGGRIDVVAGRDVPTLVYRRRAHIISVQAVPMPGSVDDGAPVSQDSRDGYAVLGWQGRDFRFVAVSDVTRDELAAFVALWRAGARAD